MAELTDYVDVQITLDTIGLRRLGFGVLNILSPNATFPERSRLYNSLPGLVTDGFSSGGPEYLALQAVLSQSPHPPNVMISRCEFKPTMVWSITPVAIDLHPYQIRVRGPGFDQIVTFTSLVDAEVEDVVTGLLTVLNGVVGKNYTATGTTSITITGTAAGDWVSVEILSRSDMSIEQTTVNPGVEDDLSEIALATPDFYGVLPLYNSAAYLTAVADWVEANERILLAESADSACATAAPGGTDIMDTIGEEAYSRVACVYHPSPAEMTAAAWYGRCLPLDPGSETWFGKQLNAVAPVKLTPTERSNIVNKNGNSYERKAGRGVTFNGTTGDGDFIDVQRGIDWIIDEMSKAVAEILFGAPTKVPYTDKGIARIENGMKGVLRRAVNREILAEDVDPPSPSTEVPKALDVAPNLRALRHLPDMKFNGRLQGAIHKVFIRGTLSV